MSTFDQHFTRSDMTPVRLSPIAEFFGEYHNGNDGDGATFTIPNVTIDLVTMRINDRVLFYNQLTNPYENGIYVVTKITDDNITFTRADDFKSPEQIRAGNFTVVSAGTNLKGKIIMVVEPTPNRIGVDAINFKIV